MTLIKKEINSFNVFKDAIEYKTINCFIKNITINDNENNISFYFKKMVNLLKNEKIIKLINMNECFIGKINSSLAFFELGNNVIELVDVFKQLSKSGIDKFDRVLCGIKKNFEYHKNEINKLTGNDKNDSKLLKSIILKIKQDQKDIDDLIKLILKAIKEKEDEKKELKTSFAINIFKTIIFKVAESYYTGGLSNIMNGLFLINNGIKVAKYTIEFYDICKKIKQYETILNEAKKKQEEIEKELNYILKKFYKFECSHCPQEIKEEFFQKFMTILK